MYLFFQFYISGWVNPVVVDISTVGGFQINYIGPK